MLTRTPSRSWKALFPLNAWPDVEVWLLGELKSGEQDFPGDVVEGHEDALREAITAMAQSEGKPGEAGLYVVAMDRWFRFWVPSPDRLEATLH